MPVALKIVLIIASLLYTARVLLYFVQQRMIASRCVEILTILRDFEDGLDYNELLQEQIKQGLPISVKYSSLKRLLEKGYISGTDSKDPDCPQVEHRSHFTITPIGRGYLKSLPS